MLVQCNTACVGKHGKHIRFCLPYCKSSSQNKQNSDTSWMHSKHSIFGVTFPFLLWRKRTEQNECKERQKDSTKESVCCHWCSCVWGASLSEEIKGVLGAMQNCDAKLKILVMTTVSVNSKNVAISLCRKALEGHIVRVNCSDLRNFS